MDTPLLSTKLFIPPLCPNLVRRPRLVERLNEGLASAKCALISAPAGYGKTALLSEWLDQGNIRAAWLSLDQGDDDVQRFLTYAIAALQIVDRGIGAGWAAVLGTSQRPSIDDMLTLLLNDLAAIDDPLVLILDDYHVITAQAVHHAVCFLLDHLPPQVLLVIATRADPPFSLARLRGSGRLVELRAADLRFTRPEIAALLDLVAPASLDQDGIATLEMRSEGWIAGLHMMALSMRDTKDIAGFVAALSGTQRHIADYLTDQVLDRQPPPVRGFLLKTSILDRLSGPLCDAVTGRSDSQAMLERLARDNLFLIPLDHKRTWYRYHHLFADLLRVRLDQRRPGRAGDLYRRASEWFAGAGDVDAALSCAHAAGDVARILDILDRHAETLWNRGQYATLLKWLDELGDDLLRARPWLRVHHALALVMSGQFSAGAARLQALERALQLEPTGEEASLLRGMIAAGRAYLAYYQRDVPGMMAHAQQALERLPASSAFWRGGLAVVLGSAHEHNGDTVAATEAFLAARAAGQAAGSGFLSLTASVHLAINHAYQGQLRRAVQVCRQQLLSGGLSRIPAAGTLHAVWGDVLREWNRLEEAREHVERGNALCVQGRSVAARAWSHLSSLKLCFSEGDLDAAARALEALESLTEAPAWVHAEITAWQARLWLAQDRIEMAARLLETRGLAPDDGLVFLYLNEYVALARLLVAQGRRDAGSPALDRAVQLLGRLRRATRAGGWTALRLQVLVLLAGARRAQGATEQGLDLLNQGLLLAEPEGFARVFLDEGEWVAQMLGLAAARRDLSPYAATLLSAVRTASDGGAQPLVEPLTERELEVLRLIADGLSNREIGDRLFITTGTVKVHASNIYGKLGVNGRVQAVAWAQELNLI